MRRRSPWSKPHLCGCPVCGVVRVDFQHPKRSDGSSSGKTLRQVYFQVGLGQINYCTTAVVLQAISGTAIQSSGHLRTIYFGTATPMPHASGRSPRGGSVPLSIPPLLPPSHPHCLPRCLPAAPPSLLSCNLPGAWYLVGTLTSKTILRS